MIKRFVFVVFVCVLVLTGIGFSFAHESFLRQASDEAITRSVTIPLGASASRVAILLKEAKLIKHPLYFTWLVGVTKVQTSLQSGTFTFKEGTPTSVLLLALTSPDRSDVQITIPEGFTLQQIHDRLAQTIPSFEESAWNELVGKGGFADPVLLKTKPSAQGLEGYLFPDTYRFAKDATTQDVIAKMLATLGRRLAEQNIVMSDKGVFSNGLTLHEVLTMASILEKEVQHPEDMKHVAGLLFHRMEIGMALQVDSTLTYQTDKTSATLTTADLKSASPYNTYTHKGLPPGPICTPGMNAILAVLQPMETDDLFFLTAPDGTVYYAKTHDQHVLNKQKYLR